MNIGAIFKNLKNKGIKGTYAIYKSRHKSEVVKNIEVIQKRLDLIEKELTFRQIETEIDYLLKIIDNVSCPEIYRSICNTIKEKERKVGYKTYLKRKYVKQVLPTVYNIYKALPIENKMIFMQPRKGLNPSCKYMYDYIASDGTYEPVLFELERDDVPVTLYYKNAVEWVKSLATAKACFVHESNDLMGYLDIREETKIVQLWHGCGVLKKIGLSTADMSNFKSSSAYEEFPEYNKYDIVTIASPELSWVFEEFMGINKDDNIIQATGVSRTDEFFDEQYITRCYDKIHEIIPESENKKIILYAPTYRGVGQERVAPDELNIEKFADALGDEYILIIKHHQTAKNLPEIPDKYKDKFAFDMTRGKGMNINELMTVSDICISDYSSLVFEFALFERPIMFFAYDLEDYIDDRGLYYDFDEITPGPICRTTEEMIDYIKNIDKAFDKQEVVDFKNKFMSSCDGRSTDRIFEFAKS
ncbi:MAG: CDP-glycerol glycerophosphotransferase family protein [Bacillota bacterium]|nr:CDP-glycerol glycerophosphotransferase family protein [Bacillota bacterium]